MDSEGVGVGVAPRLRVNHCVAIAAGFSTNCTVTTDVQFTAAK